MTTLNAWQDSAARTMSEAVLQENIRRAALTLGWLCYHTHDSRRSAPGFPDLVLVRVGRLLFVELKSARGRTTPDQVTWLEGLDMVADQTPNVDVYVWRPVDWVSGTIQTVLR